MTKLFVSWHSAGGKAQCPPDPDFPNGKPVEIAFLPAEGDVSVCDEIELQHPAPERGLWVIECAVCGRKAAITAAGRPDDPSTVRVSCPMKKENR